MWGLAKRVAVFLAVLAAAGIVATSISAGNGSPAVFCINGATVSEGEDMSPYLLWVDPEDAYPIVVDSGYVAFFRLRIEAGGGVGTFFIVDEDHYGLTFTNTVTEGACSGPGAVHVDRNFWLCFSKSRNPAVYARGLATKLHEGGYTVPYAAEAPVSDTNIGNGVYLTCTMPAGYSVKSGVAVSTGGGDIYTGPPDLLKYMLTEMPLDYTVLVAP